MKCARRPTTISRTLSAHTTWVLQGWCKNGSTLTIVTPRFDYSNGLLTGVKECDLKKLQFAQNSAARLIRKVMKYELITRFRKEWNSIPEIPRIYFAFYFFSTFVMPCTSYYNRCKIHPRRTAHFKMKEWVSEWCVV